MTDNTAFYGNIDIYNYEGYGPNAGPPSYYVNFL